MARATAVRAAFDPDPPRSPRDDHCAYALRPAGPSGSSHPHGLPPPRRLSSAPHGSPHDRSSDPRCAFASRSSREHGHGARQYALRPLQLISHGPQRIWCGTRETGPACWMQALAADSDLPLSRKEAVLETLNGGAFCGPVFVCSGFVGWFAAAHWFAGANERAFFDQIQAIKVGLFMRIAVVR